MSLSIEFSRTLISIYPVIGSSRLSILEAVAIIIIYGVFIKIGLLFNVYPLQNSFSWLDNAPTTDSAETWVTTAILYMP
jgi:hypothetical protein